KSKISIFRLYLFLCIPLVPRLLCSGARLAAERSGEITMRPTFRKLEVKDIGDLEKLVAENVEGIEPGLKIVDSRLLLGQAAIDLVEIGRASCRKRRDRAG